MYLILFWKYVCTIQKHLAIFRIGAPDGTVHLSVLDKVMNYLRISGMREWSATTRAKNKFGVG